MDCFDRLIAKQVKLKTLGRIVLGANYKNSDPDDIYPTDMRANVMQAYFQRSEVLAQNQSRASGVAEMAEKSEARSRYTIKSQDPVPKQEDSQFMSDMDILNELSEKEKRSPEPVPFHQREILHQVRNLPASNPKQTEPFFHGIEHSRFFQSQASDPRQKSSPIVEYNQPIHENILAQPPFNKPSQKILIEGKEDSLNVSAVQEIKTRVPRTPESNRFHAEEIRHRQIEQQKKQQIENVLKKKQELDAIARKDFQEMKEYLVNIKAKLHDLKQEAELTRLVGREVKNNVGETHQADLLLNRSTSSLKGPSEQSRGCATKELIITKAEMDRLRTLPGKLLTVWKVGSLLSEVEIASTPQYRLWMKSETFIGPIGKFNLKLAFKIETLQHIDNCFYLRLFSQTKNGAGELVDIDYDEQYILPAAGASASPPFEVILNEECLIYPDIILQLAVETLDATAHPKGLFIPLPVSRLRFVYQMQTADWESFEKAWQSRSKKPGYVLTTSREYKRDTRLVRSVQDLPKLMPGALVHFATKDSADCCVIYKESNNDTVCLMKISVVRETIGLRMIHKDDYCSLAREVAVTLLTCLMDTDRPVC